MWGRDTIVTVLFSYRAVVIAVVMPVNIESPQAMLLHFLGALAPMLRPLLPLDLHSASDNGVLEAIPWL